MKIIRLSFTIKDEESPLYFFDKAYIEDKSAYDNCDAVMQILLKQVSQGDTMALMSTINGEDHAAIVNFKQVPTVIIKDIATLTTNEPDNNDTN
jgi:hypothetical protein